MPSILEQLSMEMAGLADQVLPSLVQIGDGRQNIGAGTIWHPDGLILTNAHVIDHSSLSVRLTDGQEFTARLIARDPQYDLAALVVEANDLPAIEPGSSKALETGQLVMALGHPFGVIGAASAGVVIGVGSEWQEGPFSGRDWVMVSLNLRPGNSGGPLVDTHGRIVGINTIMNGPEVGVAIPVDVAKQFLHQSLTV